MGIFSDERLMRFGRKSLPFVRMFSLIIALVLAGFGQYYLVSEHVLSQGLWLYLSAAALCILALEVRKRPIESKLRKYWEAPVWLEALLLVLILSLATFLRLYRILEYPPGFFVDETHQAIDGLRVLRGEMTDPFSTGWYQLPTLYFFYLASFFKFLGVSVWTMKFSTVFAAVLTIVPFYFLARQWFGKNIALALACLMATNRWHLTMSRWGMVEVFPPLFATAAFYFLARGMSKGRIFPLLLRFTKGEKRDPHLSASMEAKVVKRIDFLPGIWSRPVFFALSGAMLGLAQYTYLAARLLPFVALLIVCFVLVTRRGSIQAYILPSIVLFIAFCIVFGPLALHFNENPHEFSNRIDEVTINKQVERTGSYAPLLEGIKQHLLMFHYRGDRNGRHNLPGEPMLSHALGFVALLGAALALARILQPWRMFVWIWFWVTLSGGFLSALNEAPQAYRTLTVVPAVLLFAGFFLKSLWDLLLDLSVRWKPLWRNVLAGLFIVLLLAVVILSSWQSIHTYFNIQMKSSLVRGDYNMGPTYVGREIEKLNREDTVYLWEGFHSNSIVQFLARDVDRLYRFKRIMHLPLHPYGDGDIYLFGDPGWGYLYGILQMFYPDVEMTRVDDPEINRNLYCKFKIPEENINAISGAEWTVYGQNGQLLHSSPISNFGVNEELSRQMMEQFEPQQLTYEIKGSVFIERYRTYNFVAKRYPVDASGEISVEFDGTESISEFDQKAELQLLPGRVSVKMTIRNVSPEASYYLAWDQRSGEFNQPIPRRFLTRTERMAYGLIGTYRQGADNWEGPALSVRQDLFMEAMQDLGFPYSVEWNGFLNVDKAGPYQFKMKVDDKGDLWIDGEEILSIKTVTGSAHGAISLEPGEHPVRVRFFDSGGGQYLNIEWAPPGQTLRQLDYRVLQPPREE